MPQCEELQISRSSLVNVRTLSPDSEQRLNAWSGCCERDAFIRGSVISGDLWSPFQVWFERGWLISSVMYTHVMLNQWQELFHSWTHIYWMPVICQALLYAMRLQWLSHQTEASLTEPAFCNRQMEGDSFLEVSSPVLYCVKDQEYVTNIFCIFLQIKTDPLCKGSVLFCLFFYILQRHTKKYLLMISWRKI